MIALNRTTLTAASIAALVSLGGCSVLPTRYNTPPLNQTAPLAGHPFVVGTVTSLPKAQMTRYGSVCLPDWMYNAMFRYDVNKVFHHLGLNKGVGKPVVVNFKVKTEVFSTNMGFGSFYTVYAHYDGLKTRIHMGSSMNYSRQPYGMA
ncbi:hypothetical protein [Acidihalobacter ferrooxydans]|uniref:Lipoprotein n=1 Tax=Acidihalobacter ferrooxydans TaxID=1765967 RepID=A0A1P8UFE8_9GAMM|nr:hypothetical protein [Acidihalobacter ferrooxydans]APZ42565.1 hypothetical protein BW247_05195 [Acidihalobacter ferrooxydans]